jgi:hypothetical protein
MANVPDQTLRRAVAAIKQRDWDVLTPLLHPYLRWECMDGRVIRGRKNLLAHLANTRPPELPESHEFRDAQIYRWIVSTLRPTPR